MKQHMHFLGLLSFALLISSVACKKDSHQDVEKNDSEIPAHADDETFFTAETDAVFYEANLLLEAGSVSPRHQENPICDATVAADLLSDPQTITVTYNGSDCLGNRTREGMIVLSAPRGMQWKNAGASVKIAFKDFKITRNGVKKSVTINGEQTYTNTSGGLLVKLATLESVTHTVSGSSLSVTFDNGSKRSWQVAQQRLFTYDNGIVLSVSGTHTENNDRHIAI